MRAQCIQAVLQALGRQITQAESQKIEQKITEAQQYLWKTDRSSMLGLTKDQQFRLAADQAAKDIKIDTIKKQQQVHYRTGSLEIWVTTGDGFTWFTTAQVA